MRKLITIKTDQGDKQVQAETRGLYAIHPTSIRIGTVKTRVSGWTVTHVESGLAIVDRLSTRHVARNFLAELRNTGINCNEFLPGALSTLSPVRIQMNKNVILKLIHKYREYREEL